MRLFLICVSLLFIALLPFMTALTLKDYYMRPVKQATLVESTISGERLVQFRPPPTIYRATTELQNDVHRLVLQQLRYPTERVPPTDIEWVRANRETIYDPVRKKTVWTSHLSDTDLKKLLIRPDVRLALGFDVLSFKPTIS